MINNNEDTIKQASEKLKGESLGENIRSKVLELIDHVKNGSTGIKILGIGALAYFLMPWDVIPDWIPFGGYADDLVVLTLTIAQISSMLKAAKGNPV